MPPKRTWVASAAAALSKVQTHETTHMGSNDGKSKESNHRSDVPDEPEGLLIDLGSDLNPDIDHILVLEKGFTELSNTTQESLESTGTYYTSLERYFWKKYNAVEIVANGSVAAEKIQEQDLWI